MFPNSGANPKVYQYYSLDEPDPEPQDHVTADQSYEYHSQILLLSSLKRQLEDLKAKEVEEKGEEQLEKSLLNAEFDDISSNLASLRSRLSDLRLHQSQILKGDGNHTETRRKWRESNAKMTFIQNCLER